MTTALAQQKSNSIRSWWASIRPFSLGTSLLPVFFGTTLAHQAGFPVRVGVLFLTALHEPVQPYLIQPRMEQLMADFVESSEHIVMKLARFHIEFEGIHPFIDGNGRTGRLLVNFELMKAGFPPIDIKFTDRIAYYNAFDEYHVKNNLAAMEKLFAGYINERLDMYLQILQE